MTDFYAEHAPAYFRNGHDPIQIRPESKAPIDKDWTRIEINEATVKQLIAAGSKPGRGIGLRGDKTPCLDIDCTKQEVTELLLDLIHDCLDITNAPLRIGNAPKVAVFFRGDKAFGLKNFTFTDPEGTEHHIEARGGREQQTLVEGIHPDTEKNYRWQGRSLLEIPADQLPSLTGEDVDRLFARLTEELPKHGYTVGKPSGKANTEVRTSDPLVNAVPPGDWTHQQMREILGFIDPDTDYNTWFNVLQAIHHQTDGSAEGLEIADEWSAGNYSPGAAAGKYETEGPNSVQAKWNSIKGDLSRRPVTFASVVAMAKEAGYQAGRGVAEAEQDEELDADDLAALLLTPEDVLTLEPLPDAVEKIVPAEEVTAWNGHGGSAKSFVLLVLAIFTVLGRMFGGLAVRPAPVLFFSAEDGKRILAHRVRKICSALGIDPGEVISRLHLLDASDIDATLFCIKPRKILGQLAELARRLGAGTVILDNRSDVFGGKEIERDIVRQFNRAIRSKLSRPGRGLILAGHTNKSAARGNSGGLVDEEDYSGSTAWHNSARSRLTLTRNKDGSLTLTHLKANYGPLAAPIRFEWIDGVPLPVTEFDMVRTEMQEAAADLERIKTETDKRAILALIVDFHRRGERINTTRTGQYSAHHALKSCPGFPDRLSKDKFDNLLRDMERTGEIIRATIRTGNRKDCEVFLPSAPMSATPAREDTPTGGEEAA